MGGSNTLSSKKTHSKKLHVNKFHEIQPQDLVERQPISMHNNAQQSPTAAVGTNLNYFNGSVHIEDVPPGAVYFAIFCLTIVAVQIVYAVLALLIQALAFVAVVYIFARYGSEILKVLTEGQVKISGHRHDLMTSESNNQTQIALREIERAETTQRFQNQLDRTRVQAGVRIAEIQTHGQVQIEANIHRQRSYLEVHSYSYGRGVCHAHCNNCGRCHHRSDFREITGLVSHR